MSSDVVLTAALRNNLLSLQNTQKLIDSTQLRLATGLKVNTALDNAQAFFAAQGLNNRAGDLSRLLDGLGQGIQTVKTTDQALTALTTLLDQASSLADEARTALSDADAEPTIIGNVAFDLEDNLDASSADIVTTDEIVFNFVDEDGTAVVLDATTHDEGSSTAAASIIITANETVEEVISQINGIRDAAGNQVIEASLTKEGFLKFVGKTGGAFQVEFQANGGAADTALTTALGFGNSLYGTSNYTDVADGADGSAPGAATAADETRITVSTSSVIQSFSLYKANGETADASTALFSAVKSNLTTRILSDTDSTNAEVLDNADIFVRVNGNTYQTIAAPTGNLEEMTIQDLVDGINNDSDLNELIEASYDVKTGKISIRALSSEVKSFGIGIADDDAESDHDPSFNLGFGINTLAPVNDDSGNTDGDISTEQIAFGPNAAQIAQLERDFNVLRDQIDLLVEDANYRGVNLLNGDDLTVDFNEDRSNSITIEGDNFTVGADGLDISAASFVSATSIGASIDEVRNATAKVRNFSSSLSTSLNIIQTRESFTTNLINTLTEGADKLVVADQNEEGANLLALQTRQALGTTSLSLASQSQQSVLRLF